MGRWVFFFAVSVSKKWKSRHGRQEAKASRSKEQLEADEPAPRPVRAPCRGTTADRGRTKATAPSQRRHAAAYCAVWASSLRAARTLATEETPTPSRRRGARRGDARRARRARIVAQSRLPCVPRSSRRAPSRRPMHPPSPPRRARAARPYAVGALASSASQSAGLRCEPRTSPTFLRTAFASSVSATSSTPKTA